MEEQISHRQTKLKFKNLIYAHLLMKIPTSIPIQVD